MRPNKAIEPMGESKSQLEICQALAPKLGIVDYGDEPDEDRVRHLVAKLREDLDLPDYDTMKKRGIFSFRHDRSAEPKPFPCPNDALAAKYPLQLVTPHHKLRARLFQCTYQ